MYLTDILIENSGPITKLDLALPFNDTGNPLPLILVGGNGSGKTILQATIADALQLAAAKVYVDIAPLNPKGETLYYKMGGGVNVQLGAAFSISLLNFRHSDASSSTNDLTYIDRAGTIEYDQYMASNMSRFPNVNKRNWKSDATAHKEIQGGSDELIRQFYRLGTYAFFPSTRNETPHWLVNRPDEPEAFEPRSTQGNILSKPIIVERSRKENRRWILDVLLDSRFELSRDGEGQFHVLNPEEWGVRQLLWTTRTNIDRILSAVIQRPEAALYANYRISRNRLTIRVGNEPVIPSLDHLSLGQSLLFNMFCTILRYADLNNLTTTVSTETIEGIVVIDEIDAHLHTDLQHEVLPSLIRLFPRVQFIASTHSPLLLMGMEKEFGPDGFQIVELPTGERIGTERFSEFERSFQLYKSSTRFEKELKNTISLSSKPLVLTEGDTDRDYIKAALQCRGRTDLLNAIEIQCAGEQTSQGMQGGGSGGLDNIRKALRYNISILQRRILLLYDCDTNQKPEDIDGKLFVRKMPLDTSKLQADKGIENLLPDDILRPEFYDTTPKSKGLGQSHTEIVLNKRKLCNWVCTEMSADHFKGFSVLFPILDEFANVGGEI